MYCPRITDLWSRRMSFYAQSLHLLDTNRSLHARLLKWNFSHAEQKKSALQTAFRIPVLWWLPQLMKIWMKVLFQFYFDTVKQSDISKALICKRIWEYGGYCPSVKAIFYMPMALLAEQTRLKNRFVNFTGELHFSATCLSELVSHFIWLYFIWPEFLQFENASYSHFRGHK